MGERAWHRGLRAVGTRLVLAMSTTTWELQMAKQREAEQRVKDEERARREEEEREREEEESKFGNRVKQGAKNVGEGFKNLFRKADDSISRQVDGDHISNGGKSPRGAKSPRETSPRK